MDSSIYSEDTIAAISTAISVGKGGVAIIRISGKESINACKKIVETKSRIAWESHRVFHGYIKDCESNTLIDEILILVMKNPNSFTGEDIVELHCHGGKIIVNRVLEVLLKFTKVRIAAPGEFSQRAFLNGKIDLTQAESINQLIHARNNKSAELAFKGVQGEIKKKVSDIKESLIDQLSEIEARIDFEEDIIKFDYEKFSTNINKIKVKIENIIDSSKRNQYIHDGISVSIIGKTNVGKSSILNYLSKQNKAIVTAIPVTTRDSIEVNLTIKNIPLKIIDNAGIRETNDYVEQLGINKSLENIKSSDYIIYVFDLQKGFDSDDEKLIQKIPDSKLISIIGNKQDLLKNKQNYSKNLPKNTILMSAKDCTGEEELIQRISDKCQSKNIEDIDIDIHLNARQISNLSECLKNLNDMNPIIKNKLPYDLLSIELRDALKNLSKISGGELNELILEKIFSKFCIGK